MYPKECVTKWIEENFDDLSKVLVEDYDDFPYGKKITDCTDDYVIVFFDHERQRVNYWFKDM